MISVNEGGPCLIKNILIFIQTWRPTLVLYKPNIDVIPVWLKVYKFHLEYWNSKEVSMIYNEIGEPISMDKVTYNMCNGHWGRPAL